MKAFILDAEQKTAHVKNVPEPRPVPNELFIRVEAIALNPVNSLYVFNPLALTGRVAGSEFAGFVNIQGDAVPPTSRLKLGNRVAGFLLPVKDVQLASEPIPRLVSQKLAWSTKIDANRPAAVNAASWKEIRAIRASCIDLIRA